MGVKVCTYRKEVKVIKVKVGNDQEMALSEKNSHSKIRGEKKKQIYNQVLKLRKHIVSRVSYFPNRRILSYLNLTKIMKTHITCKQHNNKTPKH